MLTKSIVNFSVVSLIAAPLSALAASVIGPISQLGVIGAYNDFQFDGASEVRKDWLPQAGLFYSFGNTMTGEAGLIYEAGIDLKSGEDNGHTLKDFRGNLGLGWRMAMGSRDTLDVIGGAGYSQTSLSSNIQDYKAELSGRSPFIKAAMGYNHHFDAATLRLEMGVQRTMDSDLKLKINGMDIVTADMKDRINPYVEANFLFNTQGALPVAAGVYYAQTGYQLDIHDEELNKFELQRDEWGAKVGIAF